MFKAIIYKRHIAELCRQYGIEEHIVSHRGSAKDKLREIFHQPLETEMSYIVALHEVGHVVLGLKGAKMEREADAWEWALKHSKVKPHYATRQRICANMWRHLIECKGPLPSRGSAAWRVMHWWGT